MSLPSSRPTSCSEAVVANTMSLSWRMAIEISTLDGGTLSIGLMPLMVTWHTAQWCQLHLFQRITCRQASQGLRSTLRRSVSQVERAPCLPCIRIPVCRCPLTTHTHPRIPLAHYSPCTRATGGAALLITSHDHRQAEVREVELLATNTVQHTARRGVRPN